MSSFFRAWYVFVALGLLTFVFTAFVGTVPADVSSAVALPHDLPHTLARSIRGAASGISDRRALRAEVAAYRRELATESERARQLELRLQELEILLDVRRRQSPGAALVAPVVGRSSGAAVDTITLALGRRDGVVRGMPVSIPDGLVGIVIDVGESRTLVRTLLDPQSRVGVSVRGRGGQGVAVGDVAGRVRVDRFIPEEPVEVGDVVETSSFGGLFPRGLRIGVVEEVLPQDPNELRRSFVVRPAVDLAMLTDVVLFTPQ
ncbi:rod shape-determining protein MreC [soil metagenome]